MLFLGKAAAFGFSPEPGSAAVVVLGFDFVAEAVPAFCAVAAASGCVSPAAASGGVIPAGFVDPAASWVVPAASGGFARAARPFSVPFCWSPCLFRFPNDISLSYNFNARLTVGVLGFSCGEVLSPTTSFWNSTRCVGVLE